MGGQANGPHKALVNLVKPLGRFDRVSVGFPGVVRDGVVLTAPNLGTRLWCGFRSASAMAEQLGRPVRILNDANVQALGVISGCGVECVLTMGTSMGFALFENRRLAPHLEMSQHPIRTDKRYDQCVGAAALNKIGKTRWIRRVHKIIAVMRTVMTYDMLFIGGGNAHLLEPLLPANVKTVSNEAGITGGYVCVIGKWMTCSPICIPSRLADRNWQKYETRHERSKPPLVSKSLLPSQLLQCLLGKARVAMRR